MQVNVLGVIYMIKESNKLEDFNLENGADGYCDFTTKTIVINTFQDSPGSLSNLDEYKKQVVRHEIIHAFLFESGLDSSSWARNEEIVDWIAIQFPKLMKTFEDCESI